MGLHAPQGCMGVTTRRDSWTRAVTAVTMAHRPATQQQIERLRNYRSGTTAAGECNDRAVPIPNNRQHTKQ